MELLQLHCDYGDKRYRPECLRLLEAFLDDVALRDERCNANFEEPCAGSVDPKLEVRDFAAMQLAHMLGIEVELKPDRTPNEWAKIRLFALETLEKEFGHKK